MIQVGCGDNKKELNSPQRQEGIALSANGHENIAELLSSQLDRGLLLDLQRLVLRALEEAVEASARFAMGHRPTAEGLLRHLILNEAMERGLAEAEVPRTPLRGNAIMVGQVGIVTLGRVHMGNGKWNNAKRSKGKVKLCRNNDVVRRLVKPDLFSDVRVADVREVAVFLVTEAGQGDADARIYLVVPDETMDLKNCVFKEEMSLFLQRYAKPSDVEDRVGPKLKSGIKKKRDGDEDEPMR
ncbi:hypothetical protein XY58_08620 [Stenotrophomonas maltophilia]|uniref:hypothetical protein n=1 Tax=Stenotrophomonas sp. 232 TaxID=2785387 RepID=UPI0005A4ABF7|nr:hypothetical protein [Stenotrophomonas sp. 232]KKF88531.1 hypothetical protein XY58_08620 [Stenotrophomonas maltophilia]MBF9138729.1 hypothetical protein [Stenotrophomonas sp. 232]MBH1517032.1 hypothetical protein [Stenotrophomonas maltophilia]